ncbi:unnamed protein product [Hermetia illucens]|uniref:Uncharacterized protein n=1 Tax=Hermetia illucens TaxID=343691 RepID=A0A7R8UWJ0_HERIL|nr:unnamed protein product [Hermetia illucens]
MQVAEGDTFALGANNVHSFMQDPSNSACLIDKSKSCIKPFNSFSFIRRNGQENLLKLFRRLNFISSLWSTGFGIEGMSGY